MKTYCYALITRNDKILLLQRPSNKKMQPNVWNFAGGKVEETESLAQCIIREVKEETSLDFKPITIILDSIYHAEKDIRVVVFFGFVNNGEIQISNEHQAFDFMRIDEIKDIETMQYIQDILRI